ncbi:M1 family metallopeptidase [Micrococcus sp.]|uniref:M1 family metallopeptidase n=1 Tax=Micrococcus sp. TaxID=1271 RepID=UPI002A90A465|nr:M1 family metallopeptidase [Micrococcus sp.]MDY6055918.1 M1 family metallopeptidase [Micrococcus sp.]
MSTDPYVPGVGTDAAVLRHIEAVLDVRLAANRLAGTVRLRLRLAREVDAVELDLHQRLAVSSVQATTPVGAGPVKARRPPRAPHRLHVPLGAALPEGTVVELEIAYAGSPAPRRSPWGTIGWEELTDGVLVAGQPHGASTWLPCVDSPAVKTTADITVTCDAGYLPVANGRGEQVRTRGSRVTWRWRLDRPVSPYLLTLQIGRYRRTALLPAGLSSSTPAAEEVAAPAVPPLRLVAPPSLERRARTAFADQARMAAVFAQAYGPYPFEDYTVVVADDELEIPLEAAGMSLFGRNHLDGSWESERLIAHEFSHQWFGNSVTLARWSDLWLHEGFACWSEWLWAEASGRSTVETMARRAWEGLRRKPQDLVIADPGPQDMFDDRLYKRGALTVAALQALLGPEVFSQALREWTTKHRHGTVTTPMLREHLHSWAPSAAVSTQAVDEVLEAWLMRPELPALSV